MVTSNIYTSVFFGALCAICGTCSAQSVPTQTSSNYTLLNSFKSLRDTIVQRLKSRLKVPPKYQSDPIPIFLHHEPFQIINVDEVFQTITVSSMVTVFWKDLNVAWDPADFNNIEGIELSTDLFWTPDVLIPKSTQLDTLELKLPDKLVISFRGFVTASVPTLIDSLCNFDMTSFPFDSHNCSIVFLERDFYNLTFHDMATLEISKHFGTNAAWILLSHDCITTQTHTVASPFNYITCYVVMRRRSTFFVANMIAPMVLTSLMTLMVFWMPAEDGEKISFLVSIFTSTSVFLNYIVDMIPRSMESLPQLNFLLFAIDFQVILATVATAVVLRRFKEEKKDRHNNPPQTNKWLWLLNGQQKLRALLQFMKPIYRKDCNSLHPSRKNTIHPETTLVSQVNKSTRRQSTRHVNDNMAAKYGAFNYEKFTMNDNHVFSVDHDVPGPPEYVLPGEKDFKRERCFRGRRLTHEELDMIFFVLMLLLTTAVYFYAFLV